MIFFYNFHHMLAGFRADTLILVIHDLGYGGNGYIGKLSDFFYRHVGLPSVMIHGAVHFLRIGGGNDKTLL